jgi:hypothetical protein
MFREKPLRLILRYPAAGHDDGGFDTSIRGIDDALRRPAIESRRFHYDAPAPIDQLVVPCPEVHHQVAISLAQADHGARRKGIEHQLGGCAGLHSGGTSHDLGSHENDDADITACLQLRRWLGAGYQPRSGAEGQRPG